MENITTVGANPTNDNAATVNTVAAEKTPVQLRNAARKAMIAGANIERKSLTDCKRLLANSGAEWLAIIGLTAAEFLALTPANLNPFQTEREKFKAIVKDNGDVEKIALGWTLAKVAAAVTRYAVKLVEARAKAAADAAVIPAPAAEVAPAKAA